MKELYDKLDPSVVIYMNFYTITIEQELKVCFKPNDNSKLTR